MQNNHLSRHAQQVLTVTQGKAHPGGPGSDPSIARSWLRCLEDYHLDPSLSIAPGPIFSPTRRFRNCIRLNYGSPWNEVSEQAMETLGRIVRSLLEQ